MTPQELRKACGDGIGQVSLVVPRNPPASGRIRLFGKSGPVGEVLCVNATGRTVARFDAASVLRWLDRQEKIDC